MKRVRIALPISSAAIAISLLWYYWAMTGIESLPKSKVLEADLAGFSSAMSMYRLISEDLPSQEDGLSALVVRPASLSSKKRWVQMMRKIWMDPWGEPYVYERTFDGQKSTVRIYSRSSDFSNPREILVISSDAKLSKFSEAEQAGTGQSAARPLSDSGGGDKPQSNSEGRAR